jgi:hypothetical protein
MLLDSSAHLPQMRRHQQQQRSRTSGIQPLLPLLLLTLLLSSSFAVLCSAAEPDDMPKPSGSTSGQRD